MDPTLWWAYLMHWFDALGPRWRTIGLVVLACALVLLLERFRRPRPAPIAAPQFERRKEPRYPVDCLPVHIANADATSDLREGTIANCSMSGLGLRMKEEVAAGAILSVRPIEVPGYTAWALIEVKHCREAENGWTVGCRFVRTPPWVTDLIKND